MIMKYIMLECKYGKGDIVQRIPILFFEPLTHVAMAELMEHSTELPRDAHLVSAGFVTFGRSGVRRVSVHGHSESLKQAGRPCEPLPDDDRIIEGYNYFHGIPT